MKFLRWFAYSARRRLLDEDLKATTPHMTGAVLELGCGNSQRRGRFVPPIAQAESWTSVDIQQEVKPTVVADMQHLPFQNGSFQCVMFLEVLEYVEAPLTAIRECVRVLHPSGTIIMSTPFLHRTDADNDSWRFTEPGLRRMLGEAGLQVRSLVQQGSAFAVTANMAITSISNLPNRIVRYLLGSIAYLPVQGLLALDRVSSRRLPVLKTFSTGFLAVAVKS